MFHIGQHPSRSVKYQSLPSGAPLVCNRIRVGQYLVCCVVYCRLFFVPLSLIFFTIVLFILLRFTTLDFLFDIFKRFFISKLWNSDKIYAIDSLQWKYIK